MFKELENCIFTLKLEDLRVELARWNFNFKVEDFLKKLKEVIGSIDLMLDSTVLQEFANEFLEDADSEEEDIGPNDDNAQETEQSKKCGSNPLNQPTAVLSSSQLKSNPCSNIKQTPQNKKPILIAFSNRDD